MPRKTFDTDDSNGSFVLVVDSAELQLSGALSVYPAQVADRPVVTGPTPIIRLKLTYAEAEQLWQVLEDALAERVRERRKAAKDVVAFQRRWGDMNVPDQDEYNRALSVLADSRIEPENPLFAEAAEIVERFEHAYGSQRG